jgi:hypothetical protein
MQFPQLEIVAHFPEGDVKIENFTAPESADPVPA